MSRIKCRIRVKPEETNPDQAKLLRELHIANPEESEVVMLDTLLNTKVLANAAMVTKTANSIAITFLQTPPIHLELDEEVWNQIDAVLSI